MWRGEWWGGKAGCKGENLLLTASSKSKTREQGKKKEIENHHLFKGKGCVKEGERMGFPRERGLKEAENLPTVSSKPSRRQATAVAVFLSV